MTDIVERLRAEAQGWREEMRFAVGEPLDEAAAEIERLRAALRSIVQGWDWWADDPYNRCQSVPGDAIEEARALLEAKR